MRAAIILHLATVLLCPALAVASGLVAFSGHTGGLVKFDPDTLFPTQGNPLPNSASGDYATYDETGRLFTVHNGRLSELDPGTFEVINGVQLTGSAQGLSAFGGRLYTITGLEGDLVTYDVETLTVIQGTPVAKSRWGAQLFGNGQGRLFAKRQAGFVEFDPDTGDVINSALPGGSFYGIAAYGDQIFGFTGLNSNHLTLDANTFEVLTGSFEHDSTNGHIFAFDNTGRLFAGIRGTLLEFDPETMEILGLREQDGSIVGLTAFTPPPPPPPGETLAPITSIEHIGGRVHLKITPTFRRQIGVEYSPDLGPDSWIQLGNFFEIETGKDYQFVDPDTLRAARTSGYYRAFLRPFQR